MEKDILIRGIPFNHIKNNCKTINDLIKLNTEYNDKEKN